MSNTRQLLPPSPADACRHMPTGLPPKGGRSLERGLEANSAGSPPTFRGEGWVGGRFQSLSRLISNPHIFNPHICNRLGQLWSAFCPAPMGGLRRDVPARPVTGFHPSGRGDRVSVAIHRGRVWPPNVQAEPLHPVRSRGRELTRPTETPGISTFGNREGDEPPEKPACAPKKAEPAPTDSQAIADARIGPFPKSQRRPAASREGDAESSV